MVKDRILAAVPSRSSTFLIEQGAEKLDDMVKMEQHFFYANKDIISSGLTAVLNIEAAAMFQVKQKFVNPKRKNVSFSTSKPKAHWRGNF